MNIGISQRIQEILCYNEKRDTIDQRIVNWVARMGLTPILIPNCLVDEMLPLNKQLLLGKWLKSIQLDAIILTGGDNIGETPQRDLTENFLLRYAKNRKLPVLGICRGMQMMGIFSGGLLEEVSSHVSTRHKLKFDEKKYLLPEDVNSYHANRLISCPKGFKVLATSTDGSLEAMVHDKMPWEGWMWHPERENNINLIDTNRFKALIKKKERNG